MLSKTSMLYQYLTGFKHAIFTSIICFVMSFFLLPLNTSFEWTIWPCQVILLLIFIISIYIPFWECGFRDRNYIRGGKLKKDLFRGTKVGFLIAIPYFVSALLMVLLKFNLVKWVSYIFVFFNSCFYYIIDIMIAKPDPFLTPWWAIAVFIVMPVIIPLVSSLGYILGLHEISLKEKILYTNK